jgi:hypothetical protein
MPQHHSLVRQQRAQRRQLHHAAVREVGDMTESVHVIIDLGESHQWDLRFREHGRLHGPQLIPPGKRPTILQCAREIAEAEALRLARAHPTGRFVIFTATDVAVLVDAPTHVNVNGQPLRNERVARLASISEAAP